MRDPRLAKLADVLVNYSVGVKKGQLVQISGPSISESLVEEIYRCVLAAGGYPMTRLTAEGLREIFLKSASDDQLGYVNPISKFEVEQIDCSIGIWADVNTKSLTNCGPKKIARSSAARKPIFDVFMKRAAEKELKWTGTQFPCQASAQDAEMSLEEYEDFVFVAGLLNEPDPVAAWKKVSQRQQKLVDFLNGKKDYHVVAANGTDIRMSLEGKTWINCDGHENFPDGEVFTGPEIDSVNGVVHFSFPAVHGGHEVEDVRLTFKDGKVVDASAAKGQEFLISMLDMDGGSRFSGECAIGTNYSITRYTKNTLFDEKIGGTVHFALGAGYPETGNSNQSGLHWDMVVDLRQGGYVEIDGVKVSENGRFTKAEWPGNTQQRAIQEIEITESSGNSTIKLRLAAVADLPAINDIYNHYVFHSTCTYQETAEPMESRQIWFARHGAEHPVTVAEIGDTIVGWGSLSPYHARCAYRFTVENSVYVHPDFHRRGIGSILLKDLVARSKAIGHHAIIAVIDAEQAASLRLHENFGFTAVGHFKQVGFKFGRWLDVIYLQLLL